MADDDHTPTGGTTAHAWLGADAALRAALGREPASDELTLWASMPTERRALTLSRLPVLRRWVEEPGEMTAAEAAEQARVAVSRWYEIAAAWKASPVLASAGTFAKRPGRSGQRLSGDAVNAIQSILPGLVGDNKDAKIAAVVGLIQAHPAVRGMELPHVNTLRTMVERERRRLKAEQLVGVRPGFDATACELLRPDGSYQVVFAVVDRTSRLILGFSVGDLADSRSAYARAARDALARIAGGATAMPWADETTRVDVIVGEDLDAWELTAAGYDADPVGPPFGLVKQGRRFGRYLKAAVGGTIGGMKIFPVRTESEGAAETGHRYREPEATTAIEVAVARHNAEVLAQSVATGAPRPAAVTLRILEFVAGR